MNGKNVKQFLFGDGYQQEGGVQNGRVKGWGEYGQSTLYRCMKNRILKLF
jgi:hypothetical protein